MSQATPQSPMAWSPSVEIAGNVSLETFSEPTQSVSEEIARGAPATATAPAATPSTPAATKTTPSAAFSSPAALPAPTTSPTPMAATTAPTATWNARGASGPQ
eukprot:1405736-Pyramimonas_sp.AAC.1